jgi:transcriptional regulator with XRE-family HTH domain
MESKRKIDPELGLFLYHAIDNSGYTQEKIAEQLGVSREAVNMYCSGKRKPKPRTLLKIIKLTNVQSKDIPF